MREGPVNEAGDGLLLRVSLLFLLPGGGKSMARLGAAYKPLKSLFADLALSLDKGA